MPLALVQGPNFVVVEHAAGVAVAACSHQALANVALLDLAARLKLATNVDPQLTVVLLSAPVGCDSLFYVSVANDVRGIGYQHEDEREVFDDSPGSRLEGIAFLNDFPYWRREPGEFARAFNHELGHRWAARVHVAADGLPPTALLGRQELHWSYFLDSGGSPLEGNRWSSVDATHFLADTEPAPKFSDLDLYLMGVLPPARVEPFALIEASKEGLSDCRSASLSAESPPQLCESLTLTGSSRALTIDAVLAAEGERMPAAEDVSRQVDVSFVLVNSAGERLARSDCVALSAAIDERLSGFSAATGGQLRLNNLTESVVTCAAWPTADELSPAGGCSVVRTFPQRPAPVEASWLPVLAALLRLRRRADKRPSAAPLRDR